MLAQRHQANYRFDRSRRAEQVANVGLRRADGQCGGPAASPSANSNRFRTIVEHRACAVGVDIIHVSGRDASGRTGLAHDIQRRVALRMRLRKMMVINGCAVGDEFSEDRRIAAARAIERFQSNHGRAFTERQPIAPCVERAANGGR